MGRRGRPPKLDGKIAGDDQNTHGNLQSHNVPISDPQSSTTPQISETIDQVTTQTNIENTPEIQVESPTKTFAEAVGIQEELNFNLKFIPTEVIDGKSIARLTHDDVIEPGNYWDSALICCILGANPPLEIVKGFLNRIWKTYGIDDVSFLKEGQFIVRFKKKEDRDEIIKRKYYYMDNKPVYVQIWYPGVKVDILGRKDIPIWIQLPDLDMKYSGLSALSKIGSSIGQPIRRDGATAARTRWIEHVADKCRKKKIVAGQPPRLKPIWRPKLNQKDNKNEEVEVVTPKDPKYKEGAEDNPEMTENSGNKEEEFTKVSKKKAARGKSLEGKEESFIGDFNIVLKMDERIGGNPVNREESREFMDCLNLCGLEDLPFEGSKYTWCNNQGIGKRIYSKLDRILGNIEWIINFNFKAHFREGGISDHSAMILKQVKHDTRHSFKFCDMWTLDPHFPQIVKEVWEEKHEGTTMLQVVQKLKLLKSPLKSLNRQKFQHLDKQIDIIRTELLSAQAILKNQIDAQTLKTEEKLRQELHLKLKANFLLKSQQSKADWLIYGDQDTKYFHAWVKKRRLQNQITSITNEDGLLVEGKKEVAKVLVNYFQKQLGIPNDTLDIMKDIVNMGKCLYIEQQLMLIASPTQEEIKNCLFEIPNHKSPGPDGFSSGFFKHQWNVVGGLVTKAIQDFFQNGVPLKQINSTNITVIPKKDNPKSPTDLRPIACCNVIYKVISKVICGRLKKILPTIINLNQGAFVEGRELVHNVLLCQELARGYNRKNISPRLLMKLDLQKAYDNAKSIEEVTQRITNISPAKRRLKIAPIFAACVYNIWKARNEVLHKNLPTTPGAVSQRIHTHMTIFLNSKGIIME
ncbi:unnamed protein product [Cuscuta campestris]|uniref:Reverse transcriptase domain-containing protein n=1 Tax=Cuscuta campestris TaxID=132261 RepID=A0A484MD95_9ASTE|nr:unnamed protein product [Cuscuta campestris]